MRRLVRRSMQRGWSRKRDVIPLRKREGSHLLRSVLGAIVGMRFDVRHLVSSKGLLDLFQKRQPLMTTLKPSLRRLMNRRRTLRRLIYCLIRCL